jgi:transcriptional regulator with XRE-family HTH domain
MSHLKNYFRLYRKRTPLNQPDIGFLMKFPDYTSVSRYEKGLRDPTIEFLIVYHLLFNISIEQFFEPELEVLKSNLITQIRLLIEKLKHERNDLSNSSKIKFLEQVFIRLTT